MAYSGGNPAFKERVFSDAAVAETHSPTMTMGGVIFRTAFMFVLALAAGFFGWRIMNNLGQGYNSGMWVVVGSAIGAFVVALPTIFKPTISPYTAPVYAVLEGVLLGSISQLYSSMWDGIVVQAILLTLSIFLAMLFLYASGVIKVTQRFRMAVIFATLGIGLYYLIAIILSLFGVAVPLLYDSGGWGIAFSVLIVVVASLNLALDFDFIKTGVTARAPKYMEWYASFGLFVTLVWLYLEILRLLGKLRR